MPSPTTYRVKPFTLVLAALSIWATVCLPSAAFTKTWSASETSLRYFCTAPSMRLAVISALCAGLPAATSSLLASSALPSATERSLAIRSAGTSARRGAAGGGGGGARGGGGGAGGFGGPPGQATPLGGGGVPVELDDHTDARAV